MRQLFLIVFFSTALRIGQTLLTTSHSSYLSLRAKAYHQTKCLIVIKSFPSKKFSVIIKNFHIKKSRQLLSRICHRRMDQQEFVQDRHKEDRLEDIINLFDYAHDMKSCLNYSECVLKTKIYMCIDLRIFFWLHHLFPSERCCCSETNKRSIGVPTWRQEWRVEKYVFWKISHNCANFILPAQHHIGNRSNSTNSHIYIWNWMLWK